MDLNELAKKTRDKLMALSGVAARICLACFGLAIAVWMGPIAWLIVGIAIGTYVLKKKDNK